MKAYVAVTDNDWFRFVRDRPHLDEVNFWQPGGKSGFKVLSLGQPLLFKLQNFVVGGGFFAHFSVLPVSLAWDAFGEKNGAASPMEMRERIERYRRVPSTPHADYRIGCIILHDPFFFDEQDWLVPPAGFNPQIVQGKTYDLRSGPGRALGRPFSPGALARGRPRLERPRPQSTAIPRGFVNGSDRARFACS